MALAARRNATLHRRAARHINAPVSAARPAARHVPGYTDPALHAHPVSGSVDLATITRSVAADHLAGDARR